MVNQCRRELIKKMMPRGSITDLLQLQHYDIPFCSVMVNQCRRELIKKMMPRGSNPDLLQLQHYDIPLRHIALL